MLTVVGITFSPQDETFKRNDRAKINKENFNMNLFLLGETECHNNYARSENL